MEKGSTLIHISGEQKALMTVVAVLLLIVVFCVMWLILSTSALKETFRETKTEVRVLQMHVQDQNAILIRAGIIKPNDLTTGPTDPDKVEK